MTDVEGRRYLDCLAGYSALNFGHAPPPAAGRGPGTAGPAHPDQPGLPQRPARPVLPGSRRTRRHGPRTADEHRRRGRRDRDQGGPQVGLPRSRACPRTAPNIIVADGNFHGRTTTIVSFSTDPVARDGFGPFTPGFRSVPYGDAAALAAAVDENTVAVLLEPIQGEAGVVIPPPGYLAGGAGAVQPRERAVPRRRDPVRSRPYRHHIRLRRRGCHPRRVHPGQGPRRRHRAGLRRGRPRDDVLGVIRPGSHGSTFGGNPLAAAVGHAVVELLRTGEYQARAGRAGRAAARPAGGLIGHGVVAVSEPRPLGRHRHRPRSS